MNAGDTTFCQTTADLDAYKEALERYNATVDSGDDKLMPQCTYVCSYKIYRNGESVNDICIGIANHIKKDIITHKATCNND